MLRYITIGAIGAILFLVISSFDSGTGLAFDKDGGERCDDAIFCQDSHRGSNNSLFRNRYPLNIMSPIYRAISRVDGNRCSMEPTCSRYAIEAIEKHGFLIGIIMTCDRLIHEGNEMDYAPLVEVGDSVRYADPVRNNDYWWYR